MARKRITLAVVIMVAFLTLSVLLQNYTAHRILKEKNLMNKQKLYIVPTKTIAIPSIDHRFLNKLKKYQINEISISVPEDYSLISPKRNNSLCFKDAYSNFLCIGVDEPGTLGKITIFHRLARLNSIYAIVKRGFYLTPDKFFFNSSIANMRLTLKDLNLMPLNKVISITEYNAEDLKGFHSYGISNDKEVELFDLFKKDDTHINIVFMFKKEIYQSCKFIQ